MTPWPYRAGPVRLLHAMLEVPRMLLSAALKNHPAIFAPIARLREDSKKRLVRPGTDVVIEGYWRCGNHFATYAFIVAQPRPVEVAHHFHAPAQLMLALRYDVPAVLLIREPVGAVSSATVFLEKEDPRPFLRFYNTFHRPMLKLAEQLVISDFSTTTGDFGRVIAAVNAKFDRQFAPFEGTPAQRERVEAMIREEHESNMGASDAKLPLPSDEKTRRKESILAAIRSDACRGLLSEAQRLYEELRKVAV